MSDNAIHPDRRRILGMAAAATALPGAVFAASPVLETIRGTAFGTTWRITVPAGAGAAALRGAVDRLLAGIDRRMSPWRRDSEVTRFNAGGAGAVVVSPDTAAVAVAALRVAEQSGGCFDPTLGPAVARWGFGPISGDAGHGWRDLSVADGRMSKSAAGSTFDPCGIAKGWALDRLGDLLRGHGQGDALVDLGGELLALGQHPSGRPWQVAIEDPRPARSGLAAALMLRTGAVATSGLRAQNYRLNGRTYGHIIDAATGEPVQGSLLSVSVLAEEAMTADAWATALFAAGDETGPRLARRRGLQAVFLFEDGSGLRREMTGGVQDAIL
ncbi:MAG: FAD:protein FMN transferase [Pseudooceanicola sp.]